MGKTGDRETADRSPGEGMVSLVPDSGGAPISLSVKSGEDYSVSDLTARCEAK